MSATTDTPKMRAGSPPALQPPASSIDVPLLNAAHHRLQAEIAITGHDAWTWSPSPTCAAIGRIAKQRLRPRLGYLRLATPRLTMLHINAVTGISVRDKHDADQFRSDISDTTRAGRIDACAFNRVATDSVLYNALHASPSVGRLTQRTAPAWVCELVNAHDQRVFPLQGKTLRKRRHEHKRLAGALGSLSVDVITHAGDVDAFLADAEAMTAASYHASLGVGVRATPLWRNILLAEALNRRLRCYALRASDQTLAYVFGTVDERGTYHFEATGFDPTLRAHSPGSVLLWNVVSDLFEQSSVTRIDFGFGDATYKRAYATQQRTEANIQVFGRSIAARLSGLVCSSASRIHEAAASTPLGHRLKRRWRLHLSGRDAAGSDS